jgi:hypothetical protein
LFKVISHGVQGNVGVVDYERRKTPPGGVIEVISRESLPAYPG